MRAIVTAFVALCVLSCSPTAEEPAPPEPVRVADVDGARIAAADSEPGSWLAHGRTYSEQRHSPLESIDRTNVQRLGLEWAFDLGSTRGVEATPIVVDGRMFVTAPWSKVIALDAKTGELLWRHDPRVPGEWGRYACCDVVNRGVAVWKGSVFVGTIDGRLVSLDAATGTVNWEVQTADRSRPYTITGAPRVVKGKVIIGNGGAEFGVRGYVTAYDARTGDQVWRFYTVPGNPADPFEHPEMEVAAKTWTGEWWDVGGGGTVWDSFAYDPELDLLYVGTGNGSPWTRYERSPGGGDNLYLSSILALRPDTGKLVWHYQTTPGDNWDYTAVQHMILADLEIEGRVRQVLMQAPKNGFFYVLDRATGELISARNYVAVNWASHVDLTTGRPVETELGDYENAAKLVVPAPQGGHNWHPMAFNPDTGLVYIPAREMEFWFAADPNFKGFRMGYWAIALDLAEIMRRSEEREPEARGFLIAWDPVAQKEVWRADQSGYWNGGVLSTVGGLVFGGSADGYLRAYDARTGGVLWQALSPTGIIAPPITYAIDAEQYVAVAAGWGGAALAGPPVADSIILRYHNEGHVLVFKLDGATPMPQNRLRDLTVPEPPKLVASVDQVEQGRTLFHEYCAVCHGFGVASSLVLPDLRYMPSEKHGAFLDIVRGGILAPRGMPSFRNFLSEEEAGLVQQYIASQARALFDEQKQSES